MTRRGRPRHPDILTPREWEVLGLLRLDLTNEQVAERLGITLDGAKYHVSQILSKLNVSSREEAANWRPEDEGREKISAPRLRRWALAPLALKVSGIAAASVLIAGAVALALGVILNTNDDSSGDSSAEQLHPLIGDHWHADYDIWICSEHRAILPAFGSPGIERVNGSHSDGILTAGDGYIHLRPGRPQVEGEGASLAKLFEYGGGELTDDTLQLPGSDNTYHNGDTCPDGEDANVGVWVNGEQIDSVAAYIPQDGDRIVISFGGPFLPGDPPVIGDSWLAKYDIWVCGEHVPPLDAFGSAAEPTGIFTNGDGLIHIEPATLEEQGDGASLSRFFSYAGGALTGTFLQIPGSAGEDSHMAHQHCPDGEEASVKVWVKPGDSEATGFELLPTDDVYTYIPQDGDQIVISFGPVDESNPQAPQSGTP